MTTDPLAAVGLVLLALFVALSWLTRRLEGGSLRRGAGPRVVLTPEHTVHVVEAGGVRLLVGTGPGSAPQVLARLGEIDELGEPSQNAESSELAAARPGLVPSWNRPAISLLGRLGVVGGR